MLPSSISERTPSVARAASKLVRAANKQARRKNIRSKITNKRRRFAVSGRTALGRRIQDVADGFVAALGGWDGLSDMMTSNIRKATELTALAEQTRADALRDGDIDPIGVVRLEGAASRQARVGAAESASTCRKCRLLSRSPLRGPPMR